jgi:hypothetical protein
LQAREKLVSIGQENKHERMYEVEAWFASLQQALEEGSEGPNSSEQINATHSQGQRSSDVAWIMQSHGNTGDADSDKRPKEGNASGYPVFQEDDRRQGEKQRGGIAGERVKTAPTLSPSRIDALEMKCGVEKRAYVAGKVMLHSHRRKRRHTCGKQPDHHPAATIGAIVPKPQGNQRKKHWKSSE